MLTSLIRNRKGDIEFFMLGVIIFFLIAVVIIMMQANKFELADSQETIGKHATATFSTYYVAEEMLLYIDTAGTLAATESLGKTIVNGLTQSTGNCGFYAGHPRWTAPNRECYPQSVSIPYMRFLPSEFQDKLRLPGLPRGVDYSFSETFGDTMKIEALTDAEITLPILMTKGNPQRMNTPLVLRSRSVSSESATFPSDSSISGVRTVTTRNKYARTEKPSMIVIHATETKDLQETKELYTKGTASAHYVIGLDGEILQFVPEDQVAYHFIECNLPDNKCNKENVEEKSISIALVNKIYETIGYADTQVVCPYGDLAIPTEWCSRKPYSEWGSCTSSSEIKVMCLSNYTDAQMDSLQKLTIDIVKRTGISASPENILLHEQIIFGELNPGPLLKKKSMTQTAWWESFLTTVAQESVKTETEEVNSVGVTQPQVTSINLPVEASFYEPVTMTSCWGWRTLNSKRDFHDGIDYGIPIGTNILTVAPGEIIEVCNHKTTDCKGYGTNVLIKHSDGFYSRYSHMDSASVAVSDRVNAGQVIGTSGNSGNSFGAHLDLKFYTSRADADNRDKGKNPLCYFSEDQLQNMKIRNDAQSCKIFADSNGILTHTSEGMKDPSLSGCEGIQPFLAGNACGASPFRSDAGGIDKLDGARERLESEGLMPYVLDESNKEGVDSRLLLALIAQESAGKKNIINSGGFVGLGQIGASTAKDGASKLDDIFNTINSACKCPSHGACDGSQISACQGDDRMNPVLNIRGSARYLQWNIDYFDYTSQPKAFGVAAYNAGVGTIQKLIEQVAKDLGKDKGQVTLQEVLNAIDYRTVNQALKISDPKRNQEKQDEIRKYAPEIIQMYTALGGSLEGAYSDEVCYSADIPVTVKDVGSYTFRPNFVTEVPNAIQQADLATLAVEQAVEKCSNNQGDTGDCFYNELVGKEVAGFKFDYCPSIGHGLGEMLEDCRENGQDNCFCQWPLNHYDFPEKSTYVSRMHGEIPYVIINGQEATSRPPILHMAVWQKNNDSEIMETPIDITFEGGDEHVYLQTYKLKDDELESVYVPDEKLPFVEAGTQQDFDIFNPFQNREGEALPVTVFKKDNKFIWRPEINTAYENQCGIVKTNRIICAQYQNALLVNGEWITPSFKIAVHIEDKVPPEPVQDAKILKQQLNAGICFKPSPSEDISYYKVACAVGNAEPTEEWFQNNAVTEISRRLRGTEERTQGQPHQLSFEISDCENGEFASPDDETPVTFKIVPYDKSGQSGEAVVTDAESTEQQILEAVVGEWAGELTQLKNICRQAWNSESTAE